MNAPDLHPEELLDLAAAGGLSEVEQSRLDAHLAACPACRFELKARADFAALPLPAMAVDELVTRALAGMPSASVAPPAARRRVSPGLLAAAVMLVGAASFGAINFGRPIAIYLGLVKAQPVAPSEAPVLPAPRPATRVKPLEAPAPIEVAPAVEPAPIVPVAPAQPVIHRPSPPPAPAPVAVEPTASELFKTATAARSEGRLMDAEASYRTLTATFPSSPEAAVAHAVMGRLLLDLGRAAEALPELEAALASANPSLREDALANRALALEAVGATVKASESWRTLLSEFPASVHAKRAKERLEALNDP